VRAPGRVGFTKEGESVRRFYRRVGALPLALIVVVFGAGVTSAALAANSAPAPDLTEIMPATGNDAGSDRQIPGNQSPAHLPTTDAPNPAALPVTGASGATGFPGLTFHNERRDADVNADGSANQLSVEPPDQGLCEGNGTIIEPVNDAFAIYDTTGKRTSGFESLNQFFTNDHAIVRPANTPFGTFVSDPRCLYDADTQRWFMEVVTFARDPKSGAFEAPANFIIATSKTSTPTIDRSGWNFTVVDDTNDGRNGEQSHPNCPCFGDQPLIGIDKNGVYISTNEFPINGPGFNGAQIYAIGKAALVAGTRPNIVRIEGAPIASTGYDGNDPYSLQPANSPSPSDFVSANGGTEYFVGALEFGKKPFQLDNRISVWALTNTSSLNTRRPSVHLSNTIVSSEVYGFPPSIVQPNGPTPLANSLKEHEDLLDGGDDRMQVAVWAHGHLWAAADSIVKTPNRGVQVGEVYYMIDPTSTLTSVTASVAKQGYVSVSGNSVTRPSLAVTSAGKVVLGGTLVGPDYFPSTEYTTFDDSATSAPTAVHVVAAGTVPSDGFSGYRSEGGFGVARWGDYAFAAVDGNNVWVANEYIPGLVQGADLANWGTFITKVTP
jgi:hypothetical protein